MAKPPAKSTEADVAWAAEAATIQPLAAGRTRHQRATRVQVEHTIPHRPHHRATPLKILSDAPRLQHALAVGHSPQLLKDLGKGKIPYTAMLDLHGFTAAEAWQYLHQWLHDAQLNEHRCVLVITGKGRGPEQMGVLKSNLKDWLGFHPAVVAYHTALPRDGGQGAVYVLLKRSG
jgi:DNA-nicking Smr family endonuclease